MLGLLCDQTINLETDDISLYYSLLKLKCIVLLYAWWVLKHKKDQNKYASLNNSHRNHMDRIYYKCMNELAEKNNHKNIFPARETENV